MRLSRLEHPFLIRLHFSFQTSTELFLVLDYYPGNKIERDCWKNYMLQISYIGGDLATQLARSHRFSSERARFYAAEMVLGIEELHLRGIIYRDLKPENVLIGNTGHIVLTGKKFLNRGMVLLFCNNLLLLDFGLSKHLVENSGFDEQAKTFCGTAEYLAPEVLLAQPYSFEVDLWSFGTLLYEMITVTVTKNFNLL